MHLAQPTLTPSPMLVTDPVVELRDGRVVLCCRDGTFVASDGNEPQNVSSWNHFFFLRWSATARWQPAHIRVCPSSVSANSQHRHIRAITRNLHRQRRDMCSLSTPQWNHHSR